MTFIFLGVSYLGRKENIGGDLLCVYSTHYNYTFKAKENTLRRYRCIVCKHKFCNVGRYTHTINILHWDDRNVSRLNSDCYKNSKLLLRTLVVFLFYDCFAAPPSGYMCAYPEQGTWCEHLGDTHGHGGGVGPAVGMSRSSSISKQYCCDRTISQPGRLSEAGR